MRADRDGGALRLGREVQQLYAFLGEGIDALGVGAAQDAATVTTKLTIAEIVDEEKDDVGRASCTCHLGRTCRLGLLRLLSLCSLNSGGAERAGRRYHATPENFAAVGPPSRGLPRLPFSSAAMWIFPIY
jgi:hypothetical protein